MNLLVVCQHYQPEPFNVSEACEELVRRGYAVTVLTALPNYPSGIVDKSYKHGRHRDEYVEGVRVIRVPIVARGKNLKGLNKLKRVLNYVSFPLASLVKQACMNDRYDCVLVFQYSPVLMAIPGLKIAKKQNIPCLIYCFDLWPEDMLTGGVNREGFSYRLMRFVSRTIYSSADALAVTSPKFESYLNEELGIEEMQYSWLPQYAERQFEEMDLPDKRKLSESSSRTTFTFAGNIGGNQSVETIIKAAALLDPESEIVIRIVGSGSHLDACRELASKLNVCNVEFHGFTPLEKMPALYSESDAMLLTLSRGQNGSLVSEYTIPRKLQSYLAAGKPIIAAAYGASSDIVSAGQCGITCLPDDEQALASALAEFASLKNEERFVMAKNARDLYVAQFSRERFFHNFESILKKTSRRRHG